MNLEQLYLDANAQYDAAEREYGEYFRDNYPYDHFDHELQVYVNATEGTDYSAVYELITKSIQGARDMAAYDLEFPEYQDWEPGIDGEGSYWP